MSLTDVAPPGVASNVIKSQCIASNQHFAHDLVIAAHCTVSHQYIAPFHTSTLHRTELHMHSVEPTANETSPLASNTVNSPVRATASSVEPTDNSHIAYDIVTSPVSVTLTPLTPPDVRGLSEELISAAASGNENLQWICCFPVSALTLVRMTTRVVHVYTVVWNNSMTRLAELLLCRADIHIKLYVTTTATPQLSWRRR